jgi:hypothetical protein
MKRNCHICEVELEAHHVRRNGSGVNKGFSRVASEDGEYHCGHWFCKGCLEEMRIGDIY